MCPEGFLVMSTCVEMILVVVSRSGKEKRKAKKENDLGLIMKKG